MEKETISARIGNLLSPIFHLACMYSEDDRKQFLEGDLSETLSLSFENKQKILLLLKESKFSSQALIFEKLIIHHWVLIAFIFGQSELMVKKDPKKVQEIAKDAFSKKEEIKKFLQENKL